MATDKCGDEEIIHCSFFTYSLEIPMLTIWGRKTSSNVQALMWCVGELGLDYLRFDVGHHYGGTDSEAFYMILPSNHGPAIARILSSGRLC